MKWRNDLPEIRTLLQQGPRERRDTPTGTEYDEWNPTDQAAFNTTRAFIADVFGGDVGGGGELAKLREQVAAADGGE